MHMLHFGRVNYKLNDVTVTLKQLFFAYSRKFNTLDMKHESASRSVRLGTVKHRAGLKLASRD